MEPPSGDQAIGEAGELGGWLVGSVHEPEVRRRGSPPSDGSSHKCVGSAASFTRKSSLPTSNESLNFSSPVFLGASSAAANAIILPSGRHANCWTPGIDLVICTASPPVIGITNICGFAFAPVARNARRSPAGDQRGELTARRS